MSYTLSSALYLGTANTGLTLTAALFDSANVAAAGLTTTTLVEVATGSGSYLWTGSIPSGHRGFIKFSSGATFKTLVVINPQETEYSDVATSTMAASVSAAVVASAASVGGSTIRMYRGDTWSIPITSLGTLVGRSKLWFTVKSALDNTDAQALAQVEESAGLVYLNGAAGTSNQGTITVSDATAGNITVTVAAAATAQLAPADIWAWDVQRLVGSTITTLASGKFVILADVSRATS